jgi:hypothetical protein
MGVERTERVIAENSGYTEPCLLGNVEYVINRTLVVADYVDILEELLDCQKVDCQQDVTLLIGTMYVNKLTLYQQCHAHTPHALNAMAMPMFTSRAITYCCVARSI